MKRLILFIVFLLIVIGEIAAQYKYKLNTNMNLYTDKAGTSMLVYGISFYNGNTELGSFVSEELYAEFGFMDEQFAYQFYDFNQPVTKITFYSLDYESGGDYGICENTEADPIEIPINSNCHYYIPLQVSEYCNEAFSGFAQFYKIESLLDINPNATSKICEEEELVIFDECNSVEYSIEAIIDEDLDNPTTLLSYGEHPGVYTFIPSDIPNVTENSNIQFRVYYDSEKTESSVITYEVYPCPPVLADTPNNPQPHPAKCNGGKGGFTVAFDRELAGNEFMEIVFQKGGEDVGSTGKLYKEDFEGTSYTYGEENDEGLFAGNYEMEWKVGFEEDENSMIPGDTAPLTISEPSAVTVANPVITNVTCEGSSDGEISIAPSGGTPPYTYAWTKGGDAFPLPQGSTNIHLINLPEGEYTLIITDDNGCESDPTDFLIEATSLTPELDSYQIFQPGTAPNYLPTGSIIVGNIIGESGNYALHWKKDNLEFQPQDPMNLNGLESGTYTLTIEDNGGQGCLSEEYEFIINELDPLTIDITETVEITCEGDVGTLKAQGVGGTNSYSYLWSTGEQTQSIHVGQGVYSVTVTDTGANLEEEFYEFDYTNPLLTVDVNKIDVLCKEEATGSIELEISGGTGGPYTISWLDTPEDAPLRNNLEAGAYVYFVSDGECEVTNENDPVIIEEPEDFFTVNKVAQVNVSLNGESDGSFGISLEHGIPPYTFEWFKDDAPFQPTVESTDTNLVGLEAGTYQVLVTDAIGCSATLDNPINISEPDPLAIIGFTTIPVSCKGDFSGSITAEVTGIAPFTYKWAKQGDVSFSAPDQKKITGLSSGTYILSVSDNSIVPEVTEVVVILEPDEALRVWAVPNITECFLGNEGSISISASGGVSPYIYSINGGADFQGEAIFDGLESGTYEVVVLDANQCEHRISVVLGQPGQTNAEFAMSSQVFIGETVLAIDLSYPVPDVVEWVVPDAAIILKKNVDELEMVFNEPGEYEVGVMAYRGDCLSTATKKIVVLEGESTITDEPMDEIGKKIEYFVIYPNPTSGRFNAGIGLGEPSNISLKIFGLANNNLIRHEQAFGKKSYEIPIDLTGLPSGMYVIVLETQFGNSLQKIILN